jgi:diguanylate cyclase (GGDEF)-like protein/PAS domain S-box-containing protein
MHKLQQRLRLALNASHMSIWDSDFSNGNITDGSINWSADGAVFLGLPARPLRQSFDEFLSFVHVDDRQRVISTIQDGADRLSDYELEYRIVRPGKSPCWLAAKACAFGGPDGRANRTLGIIWDISAHKAAALRTAELKELAEVTLASIADGVITTDEKGNTQYLNRIAEQLTGWSTLRAKGTAISKTLKLTSEVTGEPIENAVAKCLRLRRVISGAADSQILDRNGRRVAVEESASPIWSGDGRLMGAVVVVRDVSHERKLHRRLSWQASHDALTGLFNRREFEIHAAELLASAKNDGHVHALLYLDLDQFKVINDTCGHGAGDMLLQLLAKLLQTHLRESDILARLGGDELGVLFSYCLARKALALADQLRQAVKDFRFVWHEQSFELGVSIGLVEITKDSKSLTDLMMAADQACYMAKERGRNRVHLYEESSIALTQRRGEMQWIARLQEAFEQNRFRLFALPIVNINRPQEVHDEILLRLLSSTGEIVLPGAFIPAAERYEMMGSIDRWVIRAVCRHLHEVRAASSCPSGDAAGSSNRARYSVNLSGASLSDEDLHNYIVDSFARYKVAPEQICFEITETAAIANMPAAQAFMHKLKALGCKFALDDFGSGLSSFAYLKALPVDYLKIDGIFIRDIASNAINRALVKAINDVGHVMGIETVAEYVTDSPTLNAVRELGLDYAQGDAVGDLRALT